MHQSFRMSLTAGLLALSLAFAGCAKKSDQQNSSQNAQPSPSNNATPANSANPSANATNPPNNTNAATVTPGQAAGAGAAAAGAAGAGAAGATNLADNGKPSAVTAISIPAGTTISVHLDTPISTKTAQPGQGFEASVSRAVVRNGSTVIPVGARASGTVAQAAEAGRFKGGAILSLRLTRVTVGGTPYNVATTPLTMTSKARGKRTAIVTGGGAAVGALIGGLAGGGKGALLGTLAGGGAGAAGSAFTGNREIQLPAEATLTFRLSRALEVR